ncbi:hypothetical protein CsSME_00000602 [Camellia sinensis var. sinensis]
MVQEVPLVLLCYRWKNHHLIIKMFLLAILACLIMGVVAFQLLVKIQ